MAALGCPGPHADGPPLRVGTSGDYAPFSLARDGEFEGLDLEVARLFAHDVGRRVKVVPARWPELTRDLAAGRFDLAMGGVTLRPERAVAGTFTRPVVRAGALVLARPDALPVERAGLRLAVNPGGHLERVAARLFPNATLVRAPSNQALPELLTSGLADAVLTDEAEAPLIAPAVPGAVRVGPLTRDAKAYLGRDPALVARLDAWLREREADGTLARLRARWLGGPAADARSAFGSDVDALLALIDLRLAFMPAVAAAKREAGRPIEDPAQEALVLAAARARAAERGLAPATVEALFRSLIEAARAVQRAFLKRPWAVETLDLEGVARPALARLSDQIVTRAGDVAGAPGELVRLGVGALADRLDPSLTPPAERRAIARAIVGLRREE